MCEDNRPWARPGNRWAIPHWAIVGDELGEWSGDEVEAKHDSYHAKTYFKTLFLRYISQGLAVLARRSLPIGVRA